MNKTIFWDFDGTLAKAPFLWSGSLHNALTTILPDCNISIDDIRQHTKSGFTWDSPEKDYSKLIGDQWWEYMIEYFQNIYRKLGIDPKYIDQISMLAVTNVKDVKRYQLYEDTIFTLEACKAKGYKNYVLSNHIPELRDIIYQLGISDYFENYIISALVGFDKPRPELFEYAKRLAGYPDLCYMVGDNPEADILGGKAANMKTILVHKEIQSMADYTVMELREILQFI